MGRAVEADQREQHQQGLQQQPQPRRELHREDAAHQRGVEGLQIRHLWSRWWWSRVLLVMVVAVTKSSAGIRLNTGTATRKK